MSDNPPSSSATCERCGRPGLTPGDDSPDARPRGRRYSRWVEMAGSGDIRATCQAARDRGMEIIAARRESLCTWEALALYGTPEQMRAVEAQWTALGRPWRNRMPPGAWPTGVDRPRERWDETTVDWRKS